MSEPNRNASVRRTCIFTGHVQGVGFRYTARQIAEGFTVSGFVRNLSDGRVEIVAEGTASELDAFIAAVRERMEQFIRRVDQSEMPASGAFESFSVRY